jgi:hypothetical protein
MHVDQDVDVESSTTLSPRYATLESRADRSPPRHQHPFSDTLRTGAGWARFESLTDQNSDK